MLRSREPVSQAQRRPASSQWADYGDNGIYLDEQTSGYTIAHNAMVNAPTNVVQNQNGSNTITDTPASNPTSVNAMAGIEASYADIKTTTISLIHISEPTRQAE